MSVRDLRSRLQRKWGKGALPPAPAQRNGSACRPRERSACRTREYTHTFRTLNPNRTGPRRRWRRFPGSTVLRSSVGAKGPKATTAASQWQSLPSSSPSTCPHVSTFPSRRRELSFAGRFHFPPLPLSPPVRPFPHLASSGCCSCCCSCCCRCYCSCCSLPPRFVSSARACFEAQSEANPSARRSFKWSYPHIRPGLALHSE